MTPSSSGASPTRPTTAACGVRRLRRRRCRGKTTSRTPLLRKDHELRGIDILAHEHVRRPVGAELAEDRRPARFVRLVGDVRRSGDRMWWRDGRFMHTVRSPLGHAVLTNLGGHRTGEGVPVTDLKGETEGRARESVRGDEETRSTGSSPRRRSTRSKRGRASCSGRRATGRGVEAISALPLRVTEVRRGPAT